ncbi:tripartite tricarboxylate transporter permease [Halorarius halobius]|uniref:tripartite tricarboxylate transporter permease n=1 Tax=Halorarius halobius TaxID=2962671 RepID=UPI0020CF3A99|nr:tripartite tricarboxylate transporter permease [Halorarius halobius]
MAVGPHVALGVDATAAALAFVLGGVALGTLSGLVPGLHANNVALLLASVAPAVPGPPRFVAAAMLAAGVVHTFLDAVPMLALGVPDPAMAASALPGHRLVLQGRGREAVRLSALGSGLAVAFAVPLAVPVTRLMTAVYPVVAAHLPVVLTGVAALLVVTESGPAAMVGGVGCLLASAALGLVTLDLDPAAPLDAGGMLAPLFAGLFGAPVLVEAMTGGGVPPQDDATVALPAREVGGVAAVGTGAGALVGYLPGVSSAVAATTALLAVPGRVEERGFLVCVSGVNTSNAIFALFALAALGQPRTGVLVAVDRTGAGVHLPLFLATAGVAACAGFLLVLTVGDRYLATVGRCDYRRLSVAVLGLLAVVAFLFAGVVGVAVFLAAGLLGLVPGRLGTRRVHLMGVLMGPLAL